MHFQLPAISTVRVLAGWAGAAGAGLGRAKVFRLQARVHQISETLTAMVITVL